MVANTTSPQFDAIVVGGGLAGLSAAYTLAAEGLEVLVLERGDYSGAKNVTGGRLYVSPIRDLFTDLWKKAPFERPITNEEVCLMDKERSLTVRYEGEELKQEPYQSYSVMRGKFDRWLAKQAERQGAMIVTRSRVDEIITEQGLVKGVRAGGEELLANVVIACDGVLSFTAGQAGLRKPYEVKNYAVGIKEVIELGQDEIEKRFNIREQEGVARLFMGDATAGKFGGGFLYTNKDSISLGIVAGIEPLGNQEPLITAPDLLDRFKKRPEISKLIAGGAVVEYSAHVIPEGGLHAMSELYGDGILVAGDAAGLSMNIGVTVRGMEYAMASGYYAAKTVIHAKAKEDYSKASLKEYKRLLTDSFVLKDFVNFKEALHVLENPRLFNVYPNLAGSIMKDLYHMPAGAKDKLYPTIKKHLSFKQLWGLLGDFKEVRKI
jgi:electron transfer flavoprotein-quinone oxidoreductase